MGPKPKSATEDFRKRCETTSATESLTSWKTWRTTPPIRAATGVVWFDEVTVATDVNERNTPEKRVGSQADGATVAETGAFEVADMFALE